MGNWLQEIFWRHGIRSCVTLWDKILKKFRKSLWSKRLKVKKIPSFHLLLMGNVKLTFVHFSAASRSVWVYAAVRMWHRKWLKGSEKLWTFEAIFWILIFPDSWEGEEIDLKATKNQKSNILINPRRPLVRISLLNCLNLPIFEGLKLLRTNKIAAFSGIFLLGTKGSIFGPSRGKFGSKTLEVQIRLYTTT